MALFKCKMCGGDLDIIGDEPVAECEFCGTKQTIPIVDDEKKMNLFTRAHRLRFKNEFDKAESLYENIVSEFPEEAEAYWGICLCKYGIEYVDDPLTAKKIPTCHRTSFESIFDDENYKLACENADVVARKLYRDEARAIDVLQKDILEVVNGADKYDVFICYKETGADGQRTHDSVLAQDIYDSLTEKGLRVFFSRITLENKLGTMYEPYIFAALNSAKVMLVVGTKYEHFEAVWVKNEWNRYIRFMKNDRKRTLIPCYKDMDPYDLPDEFNNIQAQDMNKIGAMQDLVRGVVKLIRPEGTQQTISAAQTTGSATDPLLKRAYMFLEDGDWKSADEYCEKVLDIDPECAKAYMCKLLAGMHLKTDSALVAQGRSIANDALYQKALRYSTGEYHDLIASYGNKIEQAIADKSGNVNYQNALHIRANARNNQDYLQAAVAFEALGGFYDAPQQALECRELAKDVEYKYALSLLNDVNNMKNINDAKFWFGRLGDYKDAAQQVKRCDDLVCEHKYQYALSLIGNGHDADKLKESAEVFESIAHYKDAKIQAEGCYYVIAELRKDSTYRKALSLMDSDEPSRISLAISYFEQVYGYRDSARLIEECRQLYEQYSRLKRSRQ